MKNIIKLLSILTIVVFAGVACTKTGETGATGAMGPAGADGEDGIDGANGTAGCVQCHTSDESMQVKEAEWVVSAHVTGGYMSGYYASRDGCADCHSSQGMQEVVETGMWDNPAPAKPLPANCYTCHEIHQTYTSDDWNFTVGTDGIEFLVNNHVAQQGNGDACIQCHQSRIAEPILDLGSTEMVTLTNKRYGPHHGPQGNMLEGMTFSGAYEIDGAVTYENSIHATDANTNCTTCHMASGAGSGGNFGLGGHSNNVGSGLWEDETRTINANGCMTCHVTITNNSEMTDFVSNARDVNLILIEDLRSTLYNLGYLDEADYIANENVTVSGDNPLITTNLHAAAIYNYKFLTEDKSTLIHNPKYAKALLNNSLDALQ